MEILLVVVVGVNLVSHYTIVIVTSTTSWHETKEFPVRKLTLRPKQSLSDTSMYPGAISGEGIFIGQATRTLNNSR